MTAQSHHPDCAIGDSLPPDYFCPPSATAPVNEVEAYYPPTGFVGKFSRETLGEPWIRSS